MDFNLFIIPATLIIVELLKRIEELDNNWLPMISVGIGLSLGAVFGLYYGGDLFQHIFLGGVYGAAASGIYDTAKTNVGEEE